MTEDALDPAIAPQRSNLIRYAPLWVSILAVIVIATVTAMLTSNIRELTRTRILVDHTNEVIRTLDEILITIEEAETRQRGYLITDQRSFLRQRAVRDRADSLLAHLGGLVADNPRQTAVVPPFSAAVRRRLERIDYIVSVRQREGFAAAAELVSEGAGARLMDSLRATTASMKAHELGLLSQRTEQERASLRRTGYVAAVGVVLATLLFIVAVVLIQRNLVTMAAGRRSASQAAALMHSASDGIYGLGPDGRVTFMNRSMAETLGYTNPEVVGKAAHSLFHHTRVDGSPYPADECPMSRALRDGAEGNYPDEIIWRKDGTSIPVEYVVSPVRGSRRGGMVVSFRDITDRQRADAALREGKLAAEAANRAKSDFLARMSHELRTPLNSVIGFANVLLRNKGENLRPQDLTYVERIQKNGINLLGLINDILDLSKIEAGRVELDHEAVDLESLVHDLAAQFEVQVAGRNIQLRTMVPPRLAPLHTDRGKLRQVLNNLVSNAIKFTEQGEARIVVHSDAAGRPTAIAVSDSGIGIPESRMSAIFDPFEQADKSTTRKYGGTGLGLPISRSLAQLLGYELKVESVEGKGSTFTIDLRPATGESHDVMPSPDAASIAEEGILRGRLVLIIDDDADARTLIAHQVAALGGRSAGAASGPDGLRLARDMKPDLVTLDLMLPGMNGKEITAAFKADPALEHIPIIIVSIVAQEMAGDLTGVASTLTKPLDRAELTRALKHAVGLGRVLIVDDDKDTQHLLADYVYQAGAAEVRIAADPDAAIEAIGQFHPDLILLDLMLATGEGEAVLDALSSRGDTARPCSIFIVTSKELTIGELRQFETTTLGVLRKGAALEDDLRRALHNFSHRRRSSRSSMPRINIADE